MEGGETLDEEEGQGQKEEEVVTRSTLVGGGGLPPFTIREGANAPSRVCLNDLRDLPRLEAAGAYAHAPRLPGHHRAHRHQIRKPPPPGQLVSMADRVANGRTFSTDVTALRHLRSLELSFRGPRRRFSIAQGPR